MQRWEQLCMAVWQSSALDQAIPQPHGPLRSPSAWGGPCIRGAESLYWPCTIRMLRMVPYPLCTRLGWGIHLGAKDMSVARAQ